MRGVCGICGVECGWFCFCVVEIWYCMVFDG